MQASRGVGSVLRCPSLVYNAWVAPELDVGACDVASSRDNCWISVMIDEAQSGLKIARQEVVFQPDASLGLVPAFPPPSGNLRKQCQKDLAWWGILRTHA